MRKDDLESAFAIRKASVTGSSTVSAECPLLKSDWLKSSWLFCEINNVAMLFYIARKHSKNVPLRNVYDERNAGKSSVDCS